jgi:hypothetical protein
MEYDLTPKQAWRYADRLLGPLEFDPGVDKTTEWVYASTETEDHCRRFEQWIDGKRMEPTELIWIIDSPQNTYGTTWSEFRNNWKNILGDKNLKICDKGFHWLLQYNRARVARFGRKNKVDSSKVPETNA